MTRAHPANLREGFVALLPQAKGVGRPLQSSQCPGPSLKSGREYLLRGLCIVRRGNVDSDRDLCQAS